MIKFIEYPKKEKHLIDNIVISSNNLLRFGTRSHGSYRLQPKDPEDITINQDYILSIIQQLGYEITNIVEPNSIGSSSSRFKTFYLKDAKTNIETSFVLGRGENKGQKFERKTAESIDVSSGKIPKVISDIIKEMLLSIEDIEKIEWTGKNNRKRSISLVPTNIGNIISDFNIHLKNGNIEHISLKAKKGDTFGNHGYNDGFIEEDNKILCALSIYDDFIVNALGVDKQKIATGITDVINLSTTKEIEQYVNVTLKHNEELLKRYIAGAYGYGYWYVREKNKEQHQIIRFNQPDDCYKVIGNILSVTARYPRYSKEDKKLCSKQFQATIRTDTEKFIVELRHSHRGYKPNELKIKSFGKPKNKNL